MSGSHERDRSVQADVRQGDGEVTVASKGRRVSQRAALPLLAEAGDGFGAALIREGFKLASASRCRWRRALGASPDAPYLRVPRVLDAAAVARARPPQRVRQERRAAGSAPDVRTRS